MSGYIGSKASVVSSGVERKKTFAITTSTTSLTGLVYTPTKAHVFHNGVRLVDGTDYTATDGTSITLTSAAESGDEVVVISYAGFQVADAYTQAEADAEFVQDPNGAITVSGSNVGIGKVPATETLEVNGVVKSSGGFIFGNTNSYMYEGSDDTINFRVGSDGPYVEFNDAGSGVLELGNAGGELALTANGTERMRIDASGRVTTPYQPIVNCGIRDHNTSGAHAGSGVSELYTTGHPSVVVQGGMIVSSDRVTVPVAGKYLVSARQLNLSNGGEYMRVLVNGTNSGNGFNQDTGSLMDINVDVILSCSASDYIQISYADATANRWEASHSNLMIYLIG